MGRLNKKITERERERERKLEETERKYRDATKEIRRQVAA
jgi:hypothetical protein